MPLIFFIRTTKFLMRLNVSSKRTAAKCYVFIFHEAFYLLMTNITTDGDT